MTSPIVFVPAEIDVKQLDEPLGHQPPSRADMLDAMLALRKIGTEIPAIGHAVDVLARMASWTPPDDSNPTTRAHVYCKALRDTRAGEIVLVEKPDNFFLFVDAACVAMMIDIVNAIEPEHPTQGRDAQADAALFRDLVFLRNRMIKPISKAAVR